MSEIRNGILNGGFDNARDEDMDIMSLLRQQPADTPQENVPVVHEEAKPINDKREETPTVPPTNRVTPSGKTGMSPLERMKLEKEKGTLKGIAVSPEEVAEKSKPKQVKSYTMNEDRVESFKNWENEMDRTIDKRKHVIITKVPRIGQEYTMMMEEIDCIEFDENGNPYYNMTEDIDVETVDEETGQPTYVTKTVPKEGWEPKFTRLRTEYDPEFSVEGDKKFLDVMRNSAEGKPLISEEEKGQKDIASGVVASGVIDEAETLREKIEYVKVIIDKTQMGSTINFTDEERSKLVEAKEIRLTEVKTVNLSAIKIRKKEGSLLEEITKENALAGGDVTICFPGSGFRANMSSLSYGELGDIALDMETVTFNQYWKRLTLIYNKMRNISCGKFDSFEDWLKKFAYTDIALALYGLYVATYPEVNNIRLRCGQENCQQTFDWSFDTRSTLKLENCDLVFLKKMKSIANCPPDRLYKTAEESAVRNSNRIELPNSGILIDLGIASCYEFLYNVIPLLDEKTFTEMFGEDANYTYRRNSILLTTVRAVYVPDGNGAYYECNDAKNILDALYLVRPDEMKIVYSLTDKYIREYTPSFTIDNVKCPYCGSISESIEISMDNLIFQTWQALLTTEIDVKNMPSL